MVVLGGAPQIGIPSPTVGVGNPIWGGLVLLGGLCALRGQFGGSFRYLGGSHNGWGGCPYFAPPVVFQNVGEDPKFSTHCPEIGAGNPHTGWLWGCSGGGFRGTFGSTYCDRGGVTQWLTALPPPPPPCDPQQNVYSGYGTAAPYGTTGTYGAAPQQPPTPGQQSGLNQVSAVGDGPGGPHKPPPQISDPFPFVPFSLPTAASRSWSG